jgi:hypothetical protein
MAHLILRVTPTDYDAWHALHDQYLEHWKTAGVRSELICRDRDDPETVVIIQEVEDLDRMVEFLESPEIREAMGAAPIQSMPQIWFLDDVEHAV